jgi:hypothetical protein
MSNSRTTEDAPCNEAQIDVSQRDTATEQPVRSRITAEAKKDLHEHFKGPPRYARNKRMPMANCNHALDALIEKYALSRAQASRQLRNWKLDFFEQSQVSVSVTAEDVEMRIKNSISISTGDFVRELLETVCAHSPNSSSSSTAVDEQDGRLYRSFLEKKPVCVPILQELLNSDSEHPCFSLLKDVVDKFTARAGQIFPKTAKSLPNTEIQFTVMRRRDKETFISQWCEKCKTLSSVNDVSERHRMAVFVALEIFLFIKWSKASVEMDRPPIIFPTENGVSTYALPVVYYTTSWLLSKLFHAKTVAKHLRRPYQVFGMHHSINKKDAHDAGLPTELVDRREKKSLFRSSIEFFLFVQRIESVFLANLNLKMMLAYSDGDLCETIQQGILRDGPILESFFELCNNVDDMPLENTVRHAILAFVLERYVNMRGRWFIKSMKGHCKGGGQNDAVNKKAATRTKVAATIACSKARAKGRDEKESEMKEAYSEAANNVLDKTDDDENSSSDEESTSDKSDN